MEMFKIGFWPFMRFTALLVFMYFVLSKNAETFDETEIKTIIEIGAVVLGYEGIVTVRNMFTYEREKE